MFPAHDQPYTRMHLHWAGTLQIVLAAWMVEVSARYNLPTCWPSTPDQCIKRNANGTWCYYPSAAPKTWVVPTNCSTEIDGHGASNFITVMQSHLQQHLSVAYYSGVDNQLLGGSDWPVPAVPGIVRLCVSGLAADGRYRTTCTNADSDNALPPNTVPWCTVTYAQPNIQDGCYPTPPTTLAINPEGEVIDTPLSGTGSSSSNGSPCRLSSSTPLFLASLSFTFFTVAASCIPSL